MARTSFVRALVVFAGTCACFACAPQRAAVSATTSTTAAYEDAVPVPVPEPVEARVNPYVDPPIGDLACRPNKAKFGSTPQTPPTCE